MILLGFVFVKTQWMGPLTHSDSLGSGESHNSRLSSGSNRASRSRASILSRGTLQIITKQENTVKKYLSYNRLSLLSWLNGLFTRWSSRVHCIKYTIKSFLAETICESILTEGPVLPSGPGLPGLPVIPCGGKAIRWVWRHTKGYVFSYTIKESFCKEMCCRTHLGSRCARSTGGSRLTSGSLSSQCAIGTTLTGGSLSYKLGKSQEKSAQVGEVYEQNYLSVSWKVWLPSR